MLCPICKTKLDSHDYYDSDIHMTTEVYEKCPLCNYYHEYAYGFGNKYIANYKFSYSYDRKY